MKSRPLGAAATALLLTACATQYSYPPLATFKAPELEHPTEELGAILAEAQFLQGKYSEGYQYTAKWQDWSQLPVVGAAAVAAWVLLNDHSNAAKKVGKIGIGALAYSNVRDNLVAAGMPEIYIKGHTAMTCILAEGSVFEGQKADHRHQLLENNLQAIANALDRVTQLRYKEASKGDQELLKTARGVADQAITAGRTAETAARRQAGAYDNAAPAFRKAVSSVSAAVASKGRARPPTDFATLRDAMGAGKTPAKGPTPGVRGENLDPEQKMFLDAMESNDAGKVTRALAHFTSNLSSATAELAGATPDYTKSIDNLAGCVTQGP
jgi:hypothetical protein